MTISGYHAHVYYDAATLAQAKTLCEQARDRFDLTMGRMHEKPVGPHPCWSCQLKVTPEQFGEVIPWLTLNRQGLNVFVHPETGDDYKDHAELAIWLGESQTLKLDIFESK